MKSFVLIALVISLNLVSCGKGKTTNSISTDFSTVAEKKQFLERYVKFRRTYEDIHYRLSFIDGDSSMVPGPTEWNIRLLATVPPDEIDQWIDGLASVKMPDLDWVSDIPSAPSDLSHFEWYKDDKRTVGVNRANRMVLYHNYTQ